MYNKICSYCHKKYVTRKKKQKYCCPDCQHKAVSLIMRKDRGTSICKYCGKSFKVGRECKGLFCSRECTGLYYSDNLELGRKKKNNSNNIIKQSLYLKLKRELKKLKQQYKHYTELLSHIRICPICGKEFIAKNKQSKYCSKKCFRHYDNARRDKRIYRNGKPDLSITLTKLYIRDNGVCQLCGKHIDFDCDSFNFLPPPP